MKEHERPYWNVSLSHKGKMKEPHPEHIVGKSAHDHGEGFGAEDFDWYGMKKKEAKTHEANLKKHGYKATAYKSEE